MGTFSARLTGSTPVANVATISWTSSQPAQQPGEMEQTHIVIVVQIDLEHRDFVEVRGGTIVDPFDQVLTASVIDSISDRACGVQGSEGTAENERDDQEGLNADHRAEAPRRDRRRWSWFETKNKKQLNLQSQAEVQICPRITWGDVAPVASMQVGAVQGQSNTLLSTSASCWSLAALSDAPHSPNPD